MPLTIPTFEDPFYSYSLTLDGKDYLFDFRFNQREGTWFFSIAEPAQLEGEEPTPLISGVKVVVGVDLLERAGEVRLPHGLMIAVAASDDNSPPGLDELGDGKRVQLVYFDAAEVGKA